MSIDPQQLQMMQQQMQGQQPQQVMEQNVGGYQQPQNALGLEPQQPAPEPADALKEIAFLACDVFTQFANDQKLDVPTKAGALSQMSQVVNNIFQQLNAPSPDQDLQIKAAELQMKAQEHQLNLEFKQQEMQFKMAESEQKIQNNQEQHSLNMEQKKRENEMNIIHKQQGHEQSLKQKAEAQKQTALSKPTNKQGN